MPPFSNNDVKTSRLLYAAFNAAWHELAVTSHPWLNIPSRMPG